MNRGQRCISVRRVVTPKLIEGEWKTKARLVARGFEESSSQFRTDSQTCMRESIRIMLAISTSFRMVAKFSQLTLRQHLCRAS